MDFKQPINIVWLKRDLRLQDHLPFHLAEQSSLPYIIIFAFEPSVISYHDTSLRHLQFQYHSILQLNKNLSAFQKQVIVFHSELVLILEEINKQYHINNIFSYQESGIQLTYERDKKVATYCKKEGITWAESQRDGVVRGIKNRESWDKNWFVAMHSPLLVNSFKISETLPFKNPFPLEKKLQKQLEKYPTKFQPAGEEYAIKYLKSFVNDRGKNYSKHISKPLESRLSCGRISPYISWGNISIKQAYLFVLDHAQHSPYKWAFSNFLTRLKWHCHFIQKFEMECSYETHCVNNGYEALNHTKNEVYISAWKRGETGFPLIDACMKCLEKTGWLNFRMRAMVVSFFCHHLDQDWRDGVYHLAQLFLDYEPGIHYPQFQMQAGTTGINIIRIYNPVKQSLEHDPKGIFIKQWLPQLSHVPEKYIHQPELMPLLEQQLCGVIIGEHYPKPIIELESAAKVARDKIWGHKKTDVVKKEINKIIKKHTRNKTKTKINKTDINLI
jgi:deoxyribodipyrimidine photo-lyase